MKYMKQFGIIMAITLIGEILKGFIPLPIPASIYGLLLMLFVLITKIVKVDQVKEAGKFLIEIMPLMFIPAAVGLIVTWNQLKDIVVPILIITVTINFVVLICTGKTVQFILQTERRRRDERSNR